MVKGTITGILSVIKIRKVLKKMSEVNEGTVCTALESEKKSQSQPILPIEYQQGFTEESETDALLNRKQAVTYLFLDSQGKVEKMETALQYQRICQKMGWKKHKLWIIMSDKLDGRK